jgi:hypothetical protein
MPAAQASKPNDAHNNINLSKIMTASLSFFFCRRVSFCGRPFQPRRRGAGRLPTNHFCAPLARCSPLPWLFASGYFVRVACWSAGRTGSPFGRPCKRPGINRKSPFKLSHSSPRAIPTEAIIAPAKAAYSMNPFMTASYVKQIAGLVGDSARGSARAIPKRDLFKRRDLPSMGRREECG